MDVVQEDSLFLSGVGQTETVRPTFILRSDGDRQTGVFRNLISQRLACF